jgi:hypothetical protein
MKNPKSQIPPVEIIEAVKTIENWTKKQTSRDDWAIGGIACRDGFERLLKEYKKLKRKYEK